MSVSVRPYDVTSDFAEISEFLVTHYKKDNRDGNFLLPAWEYMHSHPSVDENSYDRIGIWEDAGRIVGVSHFESDLGEAFFELCPGYEYLKPKMLDHAEKNLFKTTPEGQKVLHAFINDFDTDFEDLARSRGYTVNEKNARPMTKLEIPLPFKSNSSLPEGFKLSSLAEDNDLEKLGRVIWRGFNHGGEPPEIDYTGLLKMQSAPSYQKDLNIVVLSPDENYVAYTGTWFESVNKFAYVEPVCTDPNFRRMGLASSALFEGIRRCGELGAEVAYIGSLLPLYRSMGFEHLFTSNCWVKELD